MNRVVRLKLSDAERSKVIKRADDFCKDEPEPGLYALVEILINIAYDIGYNDRKTDELRLKDE